MTTTIGLRRPTDGTTYGCQTRRCMRGSRAASLLSRDVVLFELAARGRSCGGRNTPVEPALRILRYTSLVWFIGWVAALQ